MKRISVFVLLLMLSISAHVAALEAPRYFKLTILHTNDAHGHLSPFDWSRYDNRPLIPGYPEAQSIGGMGRRATLVNSIRRETSNPVLLVDAGDWIPTVPELWAMHQPQTEADIRCMNALGYDVAVPGNHEFQWGYEVMLRAWRASKFPWVCANLRDPKRGNARVYPPFVIRNANGIRIAFLGLITPEVPLYKGANDLTVDDPLQTVRQMVPELLKDAEIVLVISHLGVKLDKQVAAIPGVSAVIGGHDHNRYESPIMIPCGEESATALGRTPVVQANKWGMDLGRLDLSFNRSSNGGWRLMSCQGRLYPITSRYASDPEIDAIIKSYERPVPAGTSTH